VSKAEMVRLSRMEVVDSCVPTREGKAVKMPKTEAVPEMPKAFVLTEGKVSVLSLEIRRKVPHIRWRKELQEIPQVS
jgi:hypothetical protein